ncbi:Phage major capsid protein, HK97 family precursor [Sphingobium herbicidovorans NBRC 16415]|uniref:Phage major capsid protein, HK97 family n=1 Tax=Sphingobium herbicidovorans (strain ATCC 700291 / DSM 11019 / CCUG 56400 / KCTC 2939 / LMG 18315 / NBRC 16415 / MH) TaxID=1219045 RepID=A0A086PBH2_SPHHM|nr:phage major capsid protein [Sphingobium herbicidovorans]KFG90740.1 Phage major capsid protein, HK97 family precursor [Sphingobium herbicidovorans NBRC 16415]
MRHYIFAALAVTLALVGISDAAMAATTVAHAASGGGHSLFGAVAMAMTALPMAREFGRKEAGGDDKTLETLQKQLGDTLGEVKEFAKEFKAKSEAGEKVSTETKEKADKALYELEGLRGEITELSQKLAQSRRGGGDEDQQLKSLGREVANHADVKSYVEGGCKGTIGFSVKAVTTASGSAGGLIRPDRQTDIVGLPRMGLRVRDLLTPGRTDGNSIEFAKQVTRTNNAAAVAEGAQKPESVYEWDVDDAPVRTVAHWIPVSRQAMDDVPQLESLIDGELRWGLDDVEDAELLLGDGTGQHLNGLYTQATAYSQPAGVTITGETKIDRLRLAILQVELADFAPDGIVIHPTQWANIELTKDAAGGYIFANPQGIAGPVLWGRPVVPSKRIGTSNFLTGNFKLAGQIFDRMDTEVRISDQDRDNFIKNMLTVRAEKRLALVVRRPAALVKGSLTIA